MCELKQPGAAYVQWGRSDSCSNGHTKLYSGLVMAEYHTHQRSEFVCVDVIRGFVKAPLYNPNNNGHLWYTTEAHSGSLDTTHYRNLREIGCVMCVGTGSRSQCKNTVCGANHYRMGYCGGFINNYQCRPCHNTKCGADEYSTGVCGGTTDGLQCHACGNVTRGEGQSRSGLCDATINAPECPRPVCGEGEYLQGSCGATSNGLGCKACVCAPKRTTCGAGEHLVRTSSVDSSPTLDDTCTRCEAGRYKIGTTAATDCLAKVHHRSPNCSQNVDDGTGRASPKDRYAALRGDNSNTTHDDSACIEKTQCGPGEFYTRTFPVEFTFAPSVGTEFDRCDPCPVHYYRPSAPVVHYETVCKRCSAGKFTTGTGTTTGLDCKIPNIKTYRSSHRIFFYVGENVKLGLQCLQSSISARGLAATKGVSAVRRPETSPFCTADVGYDADRKRDFNWDRYPLKVPAPGAKRGEFFVVPVLPGQTVDSVFIGMPRASPHGGGDSLLAEGYNEDSTIVDTNVAVCGCIDYRNMLPRTCTQHVMLEYNRTLALPSVPWALPLNATNLASDDFFRRTSHMYVALLV